MPPPAPATDIDAASKVAPTALSTPTSFEPTGDETSEASPHTKLHTNENPPVCEICNREFAREDELAQHNVFMDKLNILGAQMENAFSNLCKGTAKARQNDYNTTREVQQEAGEKRTVQFLSQFIRVYVSIFDWPTPESPLQDVVREPSHAASDEPLEDDQPTKDNATRLDAPKAANSKALLHDWRHHQRALQARLREEGETQSFT
jgi:hypothetical protein